MPSASESVHPSFCALDYGDAPTSYGSAGQVLGNRTVYLGPNPPDGEAATPAAPGSAASVDDSTAVGVIDDEDGVPSFPNTLIVAGGTYTVPGIVVNNTSGATVRLCGWIDFDTNGQGGATGDGAFGADEGSCITVPLATGGGCTVVGTTATCSLTWTVPADYVRNNASGTYARFRVSTGTLTTSNFNDVGSSEQQSRRGGGLLHLGHDLAGDGGLGRDRTFRQRDVGAIRHGDGDR